MGRIRVAVIGAGGIAGAHLRAYSAHAERCEIVGVADVLESVARDRAAEFGGRAFNDARRCWTRFGRMRSAFVHRRSTICLP